MGQPCCPRCKQSISTNDTIAFDGNQIVQLDAEAPANYEEGASLSEFCWEHRRFVGLVTSASGNRNSPPTSV